MSRYIAFLRAINLGSSRAVKIETLQQAFEPLGFSEVRTFLASGNVIFLANTLDEQTKRKIRAWYADTEDKFRVHGCEIYWLRHGMQSGPSSSLQKVINKPFTMRGFKTIQKMTGKW